MLPDTAKRYFDSLVASAMANASIELDQQQRAFEQHDFTRGQTPNSIGFKARLAALYDKNLAERAKAIANALIKVHTSFESPLDASVDVQMADWGTKSLADAYASLKGSYVRHLQRFGVNAAQDLSLDIAYAGARATVANTPNHHLWELRNVPMKRPIQSAASFPVQVNIHNSGNIGAVQTGAQSTASVQQQWIEGDINSLKEALAVLRSALDGAPDIEVSMRAELVADIDRATVELTQKPLNKTKLFGLLSGIVAVIGTTASVQPAYEAVISAARALGLIS